MQVIDYQQNALNNCGTRVNIKSNVILVSFLPMKFFHCTKR